MYEDEFAVAMATPLQRQAYDRLRHRATVKGAVLLSNGVLLVGFERLDGRRADAYINRSGCRLATESQPTRN